MTIKIKGALACILLRGSGLPVHFCQNRSDRTAFSVRTVLTEKGFYLCTHNTFNGLATPNFLTYRSVLDQTFYQRHTPGRHGLSEHFPDRGLQRGVSKYSSKFRAGILTPTAILHVGPTVPVGTGLRAYVEHYYELYDAGRSYCTGTLRTGVPASVLPTQIITPWRIACIYSPRWTPEFKFVVTFHKNDILLNNWKLKLNAMLWA
jgi:hypothetical protein